MQPDRQSANLEPILKTSVKLYMQNLDAQPWHKDWMNGANLHETGVRQMGRAEGGGRGDEERERRSGCWRRGGRGGETDTGLMWVTGWLWSGGCRDGIYRYLHNSTAKDGTSGTGLCILKSYFHCIISGKDEPVRWTGRTNNTINLMTFFDMRLITPDASQTFPGCHFFAV